MEQTTNIERKERLLRKVKLNNNGGATIEWKDLFWDTDNQRYIHKEDASTCDAGVHDDLKNAMDKLIEHLAICCEMIGEVKGNYRFDGTLKGLEKFSVSSMVLRGHEHSETEDRTPMQVFIFGNKKLKSGHVTNFGTYGIKLGVPQEKYRFSAELSVHVAQVEAEAWAYLDGKVAPPAQQALDLEDHPQVSGTLELGEPVGEPTEAED